jgi:ribosomal protein S18 acetylase RimI-like enzyme|tara:strand:- start:59 stop:523 length:465 start_codon:yes stop_codon:yes gene_type:complete
MKIRKATIKDSKQMLDLTKELFRNFEKLDKTDKLIKNYFGSKRQYNYLLKSMKNKKNCFFVAEINDKIVGYISILVFDNWPMYKIRKKGHFDLLFINPKFRNKGIGKKLVNEGYKWFRKKGIKNFTVTAHALDIGANKFWKHLGFKSYNIKYEK